MGSPSVEQVTARRLGSLTFSVIGFSVLPVSCGPLVFSSLGYVFHSVEGVVTGLRRSLRVSLTIVVSQTAFRPTLFSGLGEQLHTTHYDFPF